MKKKKNNFQSSIINLEVGVAGFEPAAYSSQSCRDNRTTLHPVINVKCKELHFCGERGIIL